jgi:hypothetical protein
MILKINKLIYCSEKKKNENILCQSFNGQWTIEKEQIFSSKDESII